jgi:hypothetical protein
LIGVGGFDLTGDGSYARNLFMVLICANDPPRRVFSFQASAPFSDKTAGLPALGLASRTFEGHGRLQIVGLVE